MFPAKIPCFSSSFYEDLMTDKVYSLEEIENIVVPIAEEYDIDALYLFGSYARGEADKDSDVDFRVDKGRVRGIRFAGFYTALEDALKKSVDVVTTASLDDDFKNEIAKDEVLIYAK